MPSGFNKGDVLTAMTGQFGDFYNQWALLKPISGELRGPCPLHGGQGLNFAVNPITGLWHCFSGCQDGGDVFGFLERKHGLSFPEALAEVAVFAGLTSFAGLTAAGDTRISRPPSARITAPAADVPAVFLDTAIAARLHENLMNAGRARRYLRDARGLTEDTLRRFQIGLLPASDREPYWRICFPVYDGQGRLTNIRKHLFAYKSELTDQCRRQLGKTKSWQSGYTAGLYPWAALAQAKAARAGQRQVLIVEGEADALVACQVGFNAITGTGGAGSWHERWTADLSGLDRVTILYDADEAGQQGARKVAASACRIVPDIRVAHCRPSKGRQ